MEALCDDLKYVCLHSTYVNLLLFLRMNHMDLCIFIMMEHSLNGVGIEI